MKEAGKKIKLARVEKGWTQQDLADRVNKTRPLISKIEKTGEGHYLTLQAIYKVLGISELPPAGEFPYERDYAGKEIIRLREQLAVYKEMIEMQKESIEKLRAELAALKARKKTRSAKKINR